MGSREPTGFVSDWQSPEGRELLPLSSISVLPRDGHQTGPGLRSHAKTRELLLRLFFRQSFPHSLLPILSSHFSLLLAKTFNNDHKEQILASIEPLLFDSDRYKQRAAAEVLLGLLRGSKHWIRTHREALWDWVMKRIDGIFAQLKPDTIDFWESFFEVRYNLLHKKYF